MPDEQPKPTPASAPASSNGESSLIDERPEILVGAAFVGGIVLAQALRILGR